MKILLFILLTLCSVHARAEGMVGFIHSLDVKNGFIKLTNGRVVFSNETDNFLKQLRPGFKVRLEINDDNILTGLTVLETRSRRIHLTNLLEEEPPAYSPTVLPSKEAADEIFNRMNPNFKRLSECSERGHVWAYDEFKRSGLMSQKAFILFTASYINRNKFKWWFHVAPMVQVNEGGSIQNRVLDFRYTDRPTLLKDWTNLYVFSKRECKMTKLFSEYDVNPQTEDCYMIIESMYYKIPEEIYQQETHKKYLNSFSESGINFSRGLSFETSSGEN